MRFHIFAPPYSRRSGGVLAMYRLGEELDMRGYSVTYECSRSAADHDAIVVYPESPGALLPNRRYVRWLLAPSEVPEDCMIYSWSHWYSEYPLLYVPTLDYDLFRWSDGPRSGAISYKESRIYEDDTTLITDGFPSDRRQLVHMLQHSRYLLSGEDCTLLTAEARLCGCPVVTRIPESEYRDDFHEGLAFGIENLPEAERTVGDYRAVVFAFEDAYTGTVSAFLDDCRQMWF